MKPETIKRRQERKERKRLKAELHRDALETEAQWKQIQREAKKKHDFEQNLIRWRSAYLPKQS